MQNARKAIIVMMDKCIAIADSNVQTFPPCEAQEKISATSRPRRDPDSAL